MAVEIDFDDLNERLSDFGCSCPNDDDILNKINEIGRTFNLSIDDFADEIVAISVSCKKNVVDEAILESLKAELDKKLRKSIEVNSRSARKTRQPLSDRTMTTLTKAFERETIGDDRDETNFDADATIVSDSLVSGKYADFTPFRTSPSNVSFLKRGDIGAMAATVQGSKFVECPSDVVSGVRLISAFPKTSYGGDKASFIIDAKLRRFEKVAQTYRDAYPEITEWGDAKSSSTDAVFTYGEVVRDIIDNLPLGDSSVSLMLDDEEGTLLRIDTRQLESVTLFPGQIIVVCGINETGECLQVQKLFPPPPLPFAKFGSLSTKPLNIDVWCASGPFTSSENCGFEQLCELLDRVNKHQPNVLVLCGPFIDRKNKFLQSSDFTMKYKDVFEDLIQNIATKLQNCRTEVIIQPSASRDLVVPPVFPASAFTFKSSNKFKKLHFVPDPCVVRVCGDSIELAITSSEILAHLSKSEWHRSGEQENVDRIARLYKHLIDQRSIYPLLPPSISSSLEDIYEVCPLTTAPNILIAPSILPASIKKLDSTVFLNPGPLARGASGTYVTSSIRIPAKVLSEKDTIDELAEYSLFNVVKV